MSTTKPPSAGSPFAATPLEVPWSHEPWRLALVVGLGLSGTSAARFLLERGVAVVGVDSKPAAALELGELAAHPGFELAAGGDPSSLPPGVDGVVLSPGVPPDRPLLLDALHKDVPVVAEVELAYPWLDGPVVAITGTNGKSTTTALTGAMIAASGAQAEVCGNIGEPLTGKVAGPPGRVFVVELSSFQLECIDTFHAQAAALLNLTPDHLDRYPGIEAYGATKRRIFHHQDKDGIAVLNADDAWVAQTPTRAARRRLFSRLAPVEDGCYVERERVVEAEPGKAPRELFRLAALPLAGVHNLENAMAAALLALALGATPAHLQAALATFRGLPHRLEKVAEAGGVAWYDDSKGTNPAATVKSLEGFADGSVHLILGGRNKGADPAELAPMVERKVLRLYFIGEAAAELAAALAPLAPSEQAGTLANAVAAAAAAARPGEVVLLSPACASFDQFKNFADRGEQFQKLVRELDTPEGGRHG